MNVEAGQQIAKEIGSKALFVKCDVRSEEDMNAAIAKIDEVWGHLPLGGVIHAGGVGATAKVSLSTPHLTYQ